MNRKKKEFRNINVLDLKNYRLPAPGIVSILHRISGLLLFIALPALFILLMDTVANEQFFNAVSSFFTTNILGKIVAILLFWAITHHSIAGCRFLLLDLHLFTDKQSARLSAKIVLISSVLISVVFASQLFF